MVKILPLQNISQLNDGSLPANLNARTTKVSMILSVESILSMPENSSLFLLVGTGGGKSHFASTTLYEVAERLQTRVLILENRIRTKEQMQYDITQADSSDRISVLSYQAYEFLKSRGETLDFSKYGLIVCDEFQHIVMDAPLPKAYRTYDIVEDIMKLSVRRFFMSATPAGLVPHLQQLHNEASIPYYTLSLDMDYSRIYLRPFYRLNDIPHIISKALSEKKKIIVFSRDLQQAKELYKMYKTNKNSNIMFICSKSAKFCYTRLMDDKLVNMLIETKRIPDGIDIIVTSTVLDVGISIVDPKLTYVVTMLTDIEQSIQCLGRKRLVGDEEVQFYVQNVSEGKLRQELTTIQKRYEAYRIYRDRGIAAMLIHIGGVSLDYYNMIVYPDNDTIRCQPIMGRVLYDEYRMAAITEILESKRRLVDVMAAKYHFNQTDMQQPVLPTHITRESVLADYVGIPLLNMTERQPFIRALGLRGIDRHLISSRKKINAALKDEGLPYEIHEYRKMIGGVDYQRVWEVVKANG